MALLFQIKAILNPQSFSPLCNSDQFPFQISNVGATLTAPVELMVQGVYLGAPTTYKMGIQPW